MHMKGEGAIEKIQNHDPPSPISVAEWNCLYGQFTRIVNENRRGEKFGGQNEGRIVRTGGAYANDQNLSNLLPSSSSVSSSLSIQSLQRDNAIPLGDSRDGRQALLDTGNYNYGRKENNGTLEINPNFSSHHGSTELGTGNGLDDSDENLSIRANNGLSGHKGNFCNTSWDGLLCWPPAAEGTSVSLPCFKHFRGIAYNETGIVTRVCKIGGLWQNKTDYSECIPKPHPTAETGGGGITHDVYFAGYCLSLATLLIAILIFVGFKELRCLRNKIHTQLILTYILADALWLIISIQSNMGHQTQVSCFTFILLHYFHLTNFFWMFVEGLYLYLLVVKTFTAKSVKLRIYNVVGWGLPLLVVISWSIAKWKTQPPPSSSEVQRFDAVDSEIYGCFWLNVNMYDWIYKLPAIIVLAANSIFLLRIMWVLITKLRSATNPETQQSRKAAKALIVLMPLLGITYVLVLRGSSQNPAYEITRALLISTQGFIVAVTFCFLNAEVRQALRHRWNLLRDIIGPDVNCSCCLLCDRRNSGLTEWSPRSQTESIRLYTPTPTPTKRGSTFSNTFSDSTTATTATTVLGASCGSHTVILKSHEHGLGIDNV